MFMTCKSLHSRKSFVLGELSFARMPSRQYCLRVNKLHCWNCRPELVNCGQWQPSSVVTQHGKTQILGLPKMLQKLIRPHICQNWTFLRIQNLGLSILDHHNSWLSLAAMYLFWQTIPKLNSVHFHTITTQRHAGKRKFSENKWFKSHLGWIKVNYLTKIQVQVKTKVRFKSLLYVPSSDSWHFVNINPNT